MESSKMIENLIRLDAWTRFIPDRGCGFVDLLTTLYKRCMLKNSWFKKRIIKGIGGAYT